MEKYEPKLSYVERQEKWIEENNIKPEDEVIVTRNVKDDKSRWGSGWENEWTTSMDKTIGKIVKIVKNSHEFGITCKYNGKIWDYPYFVLQKISKNFSFRNSIHQKSYL